jgi:hypothetical protein
MEVIVEVHVADLNDWHIEIPIAGYAPTRLLQAWREINSKLFEVLACARRREEIGV